MTNSKQVTGMEPRGKLIITPHRGLLILKLGNEIEGAIGIGNTPLFQGGASNQKLLWTSLCPPSVPSLVGPLVRVGPNFS
jgi:hypothetical protein